MHYVFGTVMFVLYIGVTVVLPIWGIRKLYVWFRKRKRISPPKKHKVIFAPTVALNVIPGFMGFLMEEMEVGINEDIFGALMMATWIITLVHALIQCHFSGLWIGPLRILIGMVIGLSAGVAILLILGAFLVVGFAGSTDASDEQKAANTKRIYRNGQCYEVFRTGSSEYFTDPQTNETLRIVDESHFINQNGEYFEIWD